MPRDSAGNFTLVPGNPVQSGTVVSSTWANSTLDDVSTALTDSLDRYGRGGMLAPFKFSDGTNLLPGAAWVNEPTTGFYRFDNGDLRAVVLTQDVMRWRPTGAQVWNSTKSQWDNILGGGSGQTGVDAGTAADNTLRWNGTAWVETSGLTVSSTGVVSTANSLDVTGVITSHRGSIPGANAVLGRLQFGGYTVGTTDYIGTRINAKAAQLWNASNGGSKLEFEVTPNGTQTRTVGMTLEQDGSLNVTGTVDSDNGESVGSSDTGTPAQPKKMETLTQSEYDALSPTYDANTLYFIVG